jgi:hypothetical protein
MTEFDKPQSGSRSLDYNVSGRSVHQLLWQDSHNSTTNKIAQASASTPDSRSASSYRLALLPMTGFRRSHLAGALPTVQHIAVIQVLPPPSPSCAFHWGSIRFDVDSRL